MDAQLRGHFRGRFAAVEPQLNGLAFEGSIELPSGLLGLDHRFTHTRLVALCLFCLCSPDRRSPTWIVNALMISCIRWECQGFKGPPRRWVVEHTFGGLFKSRQLCRDYEVRLDRWEAADSGLNDSDHDRAPGSYVRAFSKHALTHFWPQPLHSSRDIYFSPEAFDPQSQKRLSAISVTTIY